MLEARAGAKGEPERLGLGAEVKVELRADESGELACFGREREGLGERLAEGGWRRRGRGVGEVSPDAIVDEE